MDLQRFDLGPIRGRRTWHFDEDFEKPTVEFDVDLSISNLKSPLDQGTAIREAIKILKEYEERLTKL